MMCDAARHRKADRFLSASSSGAIFGLVLVRAPHIASIRKHVGGIHTGKPMCLRTEKRTGLCPHLACGRGVAVWRNWVVPRNDRRRVTHWTQTFGLASRRASHERRTGIRAARDGAGPPLIRPHDHRLHEKSGQVFVRTPGAAEAGFIAFPGGMSGGLNLLTDVEKRAVRVHPRDGRLAVKVIHETLRRGDPLKDAVGRAH